ncbi:restriction endonuclease subunit S [Megasphaera sp.]|uniref:restriction endonuclease subunit S n=1 Tax=Megasphaera sp. TaxID=2023260 RepID=UPI003AAD042B
MTKHLDIDTKAMRAKILDLAIRGKLTDQRQEDGNARDLLKEIQEEKERLIKEKKIKKEKPLPEITEEEKPFDIPENWEWVRWGTLSTSIKYGYNTSAQKDGKIKMVRISDIQNNQVNWDSVPFCNIPNEEITQYLLRKNDILFARTGGTVGKSYLVSEVPKNVVYAGYLIRTRYSEKLSPQYLKYFMESYLYWSQLKKGTTITAQPNCNAKTLGKMVLPLPPLAEQQRIADKVSAFFAQLYAIDKAYEEYRELQQAMKAKLLDLAIQGKLTDQRKEDGDARDLFQDIQEEKQRLIAEKKIKKEKPLPEIEADEIPFAIPKNWVWVRLNSIYNFIDYRGKTPKKLTEGIPLVTAKNVRMGYNDYSVKDFISAEEFKLRQSRGISHKGDLLFTTEAPLGNVSLADLDCFSTGQRLIDFQAYNSLAVSNKLFMYFIMSSFFQQALIDNQTGTTVAGIKASRLKAILIPLPPLAEQKRIVAKLDELLPHLNPGKEP